MDRNVTGDGIAKQYDTDGEADLATGSDEVQWQGQRHHILPTKMRRMRAD